VPYVIDFDAKLISQAYAYSGGVVFGGDWLQPACPPDDSDDGLHRRKVCFNHFYNINNIFEDTIPTRPTLRLLFERVDKAARQLIASTHPVVSWWPVSAERVAYRPLSVLDCRASLELASFIFV